MRFLLVLIWSLALCGEAVSQSNLLRDPDFDLAPDAAGAVWRGNANAELWLDDQNPQSGETSLRVSVAEQTGQGFATVSQSIPAETFEGRIVRFRAAVRVQPGSGGAGLWLRVDRQAGGASFLDNMRDRPISDAGWRFYDIVAPVEAGSQRIVVGLLVRSGSAWIDTASIEDLGPIGAGNVGPAPLTARSQENLEAFARLYGYVRWFHPAPEDVDWNAVALAGVDRIEAAADAAELSARLVELFAPLAPTLQVSSEGLPDVPVVETTQGLVRWRHFGVGMRPAPPRPTPYRSELIHAETYEDVAGDLPGGVAFRVPLTAQRPGSGWSPSHFDLQRPSFYRPSGQDRTTRLAAVVVAWSAMQNFYPYFDVVGDRWRDALPPALAEAAIARSETEFVNVLERLTVPLVDGHVVINPQDRRGALPFQWDWVEGQLVIVQDVEGLGLSAGDLVLRVNGQASQDAIDLESSLISGSPQWQLNRALERLRTGPVGTTVALEVANPQGDARSLDVSLMAREPEDELREPRPPTVSDLGDEILYIDLTRASMDDLNDADFSRASAAIIDMRGYPGGIQATFLSRLIDREISTAPFEVELAIRPDRDPTGRTIYDGAWAISPAQPRFSGRTVFLTDARAISFAETILGMVEAYDIGVIFGAATAGANGNVNTIVLPGGYSLRWTGMEVSRHDRQPLHGVGISPDIPVERTIEGIRRHEDEVLDAALAWLSENLGAAPLR